MNHLFRIMMLDWKQSRRSPLWHRNALVNVFLAMSFLYLIGMFFVLGVVLDDIIIKVPIDGIDYRTFKESFVLRRLNHFMLYYFFGDLVIRYFLQKLPAMSIAPYLHLPIKKASLVNFMLVKSIWSPFNLIHFVIFIPFMTEVFANLEFWSAMGWTISFSSLVFFNNYLLLYLKRTSEINAKVYLGMLASLVLILLLDWFDLVDFQVVSASVFNSFFLYPAASLVPVALILGAYLLNFKYLMANMYLNKISKTKQNEVSYVGSGILSRFGLVGRLSELEFKFIWRNKRPRAVLLMTILFLGYGLFVFPNPQYAGSYYMYILFSIIITGMFMMNYGQYLLGWEGSHFDHILTRNVSFEDYYLSKFLLFAIVSGAAMVLSLPYVYFGWDVILILFCVFLFNLGISSHIVMFFGSMNPKKIDMTQGSVLNWQGVGAAQFLMIIPVMALPIVIYFIGNMLWGPNGAVILFGVIGLLGLAVTRFWIGLLAKWLRGQRYEISNDFRNQ
jgi:hypothetical protein